MGHSHTNFSELVWFAGWLIAVLALFVVALRLPLQIRLKRRSGCLYAWSIALTAIGSAILANVAISLHDTHVDLTREKVFTPALEALRVVDTLSRHVSLVYFYQGNDPNGKRLKDMVQVLGRRNPRLRVRTVDPDQEPTLAQTFGFKFYNTAVLEAAGRRVLVNSVDENEIAIGIQRVLREKVLTVCFIEGHNEFPMDNFEYHTHLEGPHDHSHGDAASKVVQMHGHGVGRFRRSLEALGFDVRKVILATEGELPAPCTVAVDANPRTTYLPAESAALEAYLQRGGSLLLLFDLGFTLETRLAALLKRLGVDMPQAIVVDPVEHYSTDPEIVAVTPDGQHAVTKGVALTFFPGVRPLKLGQPGAGITTTALMSSSKDSFARPVEPVQERQVDADAQSSASRVVQSTREGSPGAHVLAMAAEGKWSDDATHTFRAVVIGDSDFASNSFYPFVGNSDLALGAIRWLAREEKSAAVASRIPVPPLIVLTKPQMRSVFLLIEVFIPLSVLVVGGVVWWKRR